MALVVLVGVTVAVAFKYRNRRKAQPPQPKLAIACCRHLSLAEVEAATENFHESRLIGVGGFGKVYRGQLDGGDVAIKRATPKSNHELHQFQTEIESLSTLRHRHLASLTGCCKEDGELILINDFMSEGTLELALKLQEYGLDRKKTICRDSEMDSYVHEAGLLEEQW